MINIIHDKAYNTSFHQINYNSALAITEAIKETFKENIYQGLGLQSIEKKPNGIENICYNYKIFNK